MSTAVTTLDRYLDNFRAEAADGEAADRTTGIDVGNLDLAKLARAAWDALLQANDPPVLFRFAGLLARIERGQDGLPLVRPLTEDRLRHRLARVTEWYRYNPVSGRRSSALPPMHLVRDMLAAPEPPLPALTRIVGAPVFAHDGTLRTQPGYDPASRSYYSPAAGLQIPEVPHNPSPDDITRARTLITIDLLCDFPFVGEPERAHAVGLLLLPFVRELIPGATPLHLVEKPTPGTGATLLAEVLLYPFLGHPAPSLTEGRDEDEWRKRLTSKLLTGACVVLVDNLRGRLQSAALSSAITAATWEDRVLRRSEMARIPVRCIWIATANNPALSAEIARRTIRIRLDAKTDRPWLRRDFHHPDLRRWAAKHRPELIWAAATLGSAWLAAGRPAGTAHLGMFEDWAATIGGILDVAGVPGLLENVDDFCNDSDAEGATWRAFVEAWFDAHGTQAVGVADLWRLVNSDDNGSFDLELGTGNERSQRTRFGKLLASQRDRQFRDLRIVKATSKGRAQTWKLNRLR